MHQQREEYSFGPDSAGYAARRRDFMLAQTRKLSWCIAAGAATASIVLGAAFARELPGHHHVAAAGTQSGAAQQGPRQSGSAPADQPSAPAAHSHAPAQQLAPPKQAPATAPPAPQPQVTSGGS